MEMLDVHHTQWTQVREYDQKIEQRAEKHKSLSGRNNTTSCRSPSRGLDIRWIKTELKHKRQEEFHRRRSVSPERASNPMRDNSCVICNTAMSETLWAKEMVTPKTETLWVKEMVTPKTETLVAKEMVTPKTETLWAKEMVTPKTETLWAKEMVTPKTETLWVKEMVTPKTETLGVKEMVTPKTETLKSERAKNTARFKDDSCVICDEAMTELLQMNHLPLPPPPAGQPLMPPPQSGIQKGTDESNRSKTTLTEASAQTEPGFVTVKESEVLQLADYLQEALWREEGLKRKLAVIQKSSSTLLLHTDNLWTTRCNEDLLKTNIRALESQLRVCLKKQKLPQDEVKAQALQMERQKEAYEGKALEVIQRATEEKKQALSQAETLEMLLQTAREEAARCQSQYEMMKERSEQLENTRKAGADQLLQLHNQLELVWGQEAGLREDLQVMQHVEEELRYNMAVLEEENQSLAHEVQKTKDASVVTQDFWGGPSTQSALWPENSEEVEENLALLDSFLEEQEEEKTEEVMEEAEEEGPSGNGDQVVEQLRQTQERLHLKEKECEELQGVLEATEAECQSFQIRLTQCREELRLLNQRHGSKKPGVCYLRFCVFFVLLLLTVGTAAIFWAWLPSFGDQVQQLYSTVVERIEDYLLQASSGQNPPCL
ncbi:hypothetical protein DPEC_G00015680 [Dallia pectoralis]|uniref:Uncharacterized protein n=1 Tax=Dallia pectoralis TaxID=75939 RepID=A0ACC2HMH8_DALPE|nr:hypothetical protein DPEC_G00015680 [Dallia pectoralis]